MKITKSILKQIIKEELFIVLEARGQEGPWFSSGLGDIFSKEESPEEQGEGSYWKATAMQNVSKEDPINAGDHHNIIEVAKQMADKHGFPAEEESVPYIDSEGEKKIHRSKPLLWGPLKWRLFKDRAIYYIMYTGSTKFDPELEKEELLIRKDYPKIARPVKKKPRMPPSRTDTDPFSGQKRPAAGATYQQRLHNQYLKKQGKQ
jgi:hypothetical protein